MEQEVIDTSGAYGRRVNTGINIGDKGNWAFFTSIWPSCCLAQSPKVVEMSGLVHGKITTRGHESKILEVGYVKRLARRHPFPAGTRGVFCFHHVEGDDINSQLRFRLCHTLDEFVNGSGLLLPDGHTWSRSLRYMARARRSFAPLLTLLTAEFSILAAQVDPSLTSHRVVTTLSPQDLVSKGQEVFDISGITSANYAADSARRTDRTDYVRLTYHHAGRDLLPFPAGTLGLLYYKQSSTLPSEIGELRFRLCSDSSMFDQGSDLCLPSGDPWFRSWTDLCLLWLLANVLYQDGLLKQSSVLARFRLTLILNLYHSGPIFGTQN
ncbi:hypothetical protein D9619_007659 [Psilocybe cf. subviscida]|uniref:Uncharacterized protein n=1 Tax=Psilocybe cf. subviscida TaxID=2480587 RepID=A0A8H5AUA7_9AGAR|nr:hypothetical protein D9619_007659 [Psilocybe cf. subviscida]